MAEQVGSFGALLAECGWAKFIALQAHLSFSNVLGRQVSVQIRFWLPAKRSSFVDLSVRLGLALILPEQKRVQPRF